MEQQITKYNVSVVSIGPGTRSAPCKGGQKEPLILLHETATFFHKVLDDAGTSNDVSVSRGIYENENVTTGVNKITFN